MPDEKTFQRYPGWRVHPTLPPKTVENEDEDAAAAAEGYADPADLTPKQPAPASKDDDDEDEEASDASPVHEKPHHAPHKAAAHKPPARRSK